MLLPLGLRLASSRSSTTLARSTGVDRKARTDLRLAIASSTISRAMIVDPSLATSCIGRAQHLQAFGDLAEEHPLDVIIMQELLGRSGIGDLAEMHHISVVGDSERVRRLLLDHHHGQSFL